MQLAYPLEITRPDFAAHLQFLRDCGVEHVPLYTMLNPEDYCAAFGAGTHHGEVLDRFRRCVEEVREAGFALDVVYIFPGYGIVNTLAGDAEQRRRFTELCAVCGELVFRDLGAFPRVPAREEADPAWWEGTVAGARIMSDLAGEVGMRISNHLNMFGGCCLDRVEDVEALFAAVDRDNWGLLFCFGCLALAGLDIAETVYRWRDRIFTVHLRDVRGTWQEGGEEAQFGTGRIDLPAALGALRETGYRGVVHPEHFPAWPSDRAPEARELWTHRSDRDAPNLAWTLGYCRALLGPTP